MTAATPSLPPALLADGAARLLAAHPHVAVEAPVVAALLASCSPRQLAPGEALCREGEPSDAMWFLLQGCIRVERADLSGQPRHIGTLTAPTLLGQMGLVDRARRSASCIAEDAVTVAVLDRAAFRATVRALDERGTALRRLLLSSLTHQMTQGNARLRALLAGDGPPEPTTQLGSSLMKAASTLGGWTTAS